MNDTSSAAAPRMPESGKGLVTIGVGGSIVWLLITVGYSIYAGAEFKDLQPNEIGDFLAGVFAPLAFFWLVLGFLQQGAELRNSGQALWLQGEELRNSVEQQRQLVDVTREQLAFESNRITQEQSRARQLAQPMFDLTLGGLTSAGGTPVSTNQEFILTNHGMTCTRVLVTMNGLEAMSVPKIAQGEKIIFRRLMRHGFGEAVVTASYLDAHQEEGVTQFSLAEISPGRMNISQHL